ncbi:MAG TPA: MG2 domain-containing protein, partial [Puia sp.]
MKRILLISTFIFCCKSGAFSQLYSAEAHVVDQLKNFVSTYDPEKAYVQFDRPYYAAGDTIYFKAYVTQGGRHKLSISSGVLHVDLINPENRIEQSIRLRLDSGVCWGDFALPDSLPTGNYRVRAYTQWMRNLGELDFFDQNMYVRSISKQPVPDQLFKQTGHEKINNADLQFFPEGGNLVEAVETKLAFKAIGKNGLSIHAKGVILDKGNMPVCSIESSRLGMGYIMFKPEKGELYKAKLSFDDGTQNTIDLPRPEASGISLAVDYDSNSTISIKITANGAYYLANRNKDFLLVIYSGGKVMSYSFKQEDPRITLSMDRKLLQ